MPDITIEKLFDHVKRMDAKLTTLLNREPKVTWVRASVITELTGWNNEKMRKARENGYVKFKKEGGYWYNLGSLNQVFIKKT